MTALWVALGAAVGAPLRYLVDTAVKSRLRGAFPGGTLVVNVVGSFVLGVVTGAAAAPAPAALVGTGFCGALTTYSTFGYETAALLERRKAGVAVANVLVSVVAGLAVAAAGFALGRALA